MIAIGGTSEHKSAFSVGSSEKTGDSAEKRRVYLAL